MKTVHRKLLIPALIIIASSALTAQAAQAPGGPRDQQEAHSTWETISQKAEQISETTTDYASQALVAPCKIMVQALVFSKNSYHNFNSWVAGRNQPKNVPVKPPLFLYADPALFQDNQPVIIDCSEFYQSKK
jgi:hypothetical protein